MQVSVETGEGSERTLKIQIPAETINQEVDSRIQSMSGNIKIDGFRPGKVPLSVIKKKYAANVFQDIVGETIQKTYQEALSQEKLSPIGNPVIETKSMELGKDLEYTATFDVAEDITITPASELKLEKLEAEISDADLDSMLDTLRTQRAQWSEVDRAAEDGDKVSISFKGTIDGVEFDGGSAENTPVVIGSGAMIPGFEDQLKGLSKSETTTVKTPFPDTYEVKDLAGKEAEFAIVVIAVEASELPEINEDFAKAFGIEDGNVETLKADITENMQRELDNRIRSDLKSKVVEQLLEKNQVNVPKSLMLEEAQSLKLKAAEMMKSADVPLESFTDEASRRVKLGLIMKEVATQANLSLTQEMIKEKVELMSKEYSDPEEFVNHYMSNQDLLKSVENLLVEDQIVDWVISEATVSNVKTTFDELMK